MFESFLYGFLHISWQPKKTTPNIPNGQSCFFFLVRRRDYRKIWSLLFGDGALGGKFRNHRCNKHTWLAGLFACFLLFLFVNFFFCKAKNTLYTLCQIFNKPTLKSLPNMSSQIYLSNPHPQNHSNPGYCFFVVRVCCFPNLLPGKPVYRVVEHVGRKQVLTGRPPALQHPNGKIEYQCGIRVTGMEPGIHRRNAFQHNFPKVPIPAESPSKPSHIASPGTNGIFAYKFTIHLSQMYR